MVHYFAYGSNLHPQRLIERVPSARLLGTSILRQHRLVFHKIGIDGSGKCSLIKTELEGDAVLGAIYTFEIEHKSLLDEFESLGRGYHDQKIVVEYDGMQFDCITYIAQPDFTDSSLSPFHWYKQLVLLGARHLAFPEAYIDSISRVLSIEDPDAERRALHEQLLGRIRGDS